MAESRPDVVAALRRGPTWFLARGEPGLGRLMETLSLARIVADGQPQGRIRLLTSAAAVPLARGLCPFPVDDFDLERGDDLQQTLIDSRAVQGLLERLARRQPAALVVDGYAFLLPLLRAVCGARLVAVANRHDLDNPAHSLGARLLQVALHSPADLILVGELRRGWRLTQLGGLPVVRLPALVRPEAIAAADGTALESGVVAVLGGGSRGDAHLKESTEAILTALDRAVEREEIADCRVFCGPGTGWEPDRYPHLNAGLDPADGLDAMRRARVVVARAGRSTLAEILSLGKRAVVVAARSDTLRGGEQAANARLAAALSPAVVALEMARLDQIGSACRRVAELEPRRWRPGNRVVWTALAAADRRTALVPPSPVRGR
ncbi:MAG: glycosyltransferase [Candidatus Dormibacteria bacterium]